MTSKEKCDKITIKCKKTIKSEMEPPRLIIVLHSVVRTMTTCSNDSSIKYKNIHSNNKHK